MNRKPKLDTVKRIVLEHRGVVLRVFALMCLFLIGITIYKHFFNPFFLPDIEQRTLVALIPLGLITIALYFPYGWVASKFNNLSLRWASYIKKRKFDHTIVSMSIGGTRIDLFHLVRKTAIGIFLILLIMIILEAIFGWEFLTSYQTYLIIAAVVSGALAMVLNREKVKLKDEIEQEESEEVERKSEFRTKFPRINRIPVARWFIKWMYKEGWGYVVAVILLILIGGYLRFSNLNNLEIHHDEFYTVLAVKGYVETGHFVLWDFVNNIPGEEYERSFIYTWSVAQSVKIFGFNEFGFRFPGVIVGTLTIILAYLIIKRLTTKNIALIATTTIIFNEFVIYLSRFARNYTFFIFTFFLLVYISFKAIEELFNTVGENIVGIKGYISEYHKVIIYAVLAVFVFLFSFHLSPLTVLAIPPIMAYYLFKTILNMIHTHKILNFHTILFIFILFMGVAIVVADYFGWVHVVGTKNILEKHFTILDKPQFIYFKYLFGTYKSALVVVLAILGSILLLLKFWRRGLFLLLITGISLLSMVYLFSRYEDFRYISFLIPFACIIIAVGLVELTRIIFQFFNISVKRGLIAVICIPILLLLVIYPSFPGIHIAPVTHTAQADWTGDEGKIYIHRRAVAGDFKKAFSYLNQNIGSDDALIIDTYAYGSTMYIDFSQGSDVYKLDINGDMIVVKSQFYPSGSDILFWEVLELYDGVWVIMWYSHLYDQNIINFLVENSINYAPEIGIKRYQYNSYYKGKDLYWPNIFLIK